MIQREIKFRGKRKDNNEWVYGGYFKNSEQEGVIHYIFDFVNGASEVFPESIGEFTGKLDRNGKEIYEGDIIGRTTIADRIVYWDNCGFRTKKINNNRVLDLFVDAFDQVIGNTCCCTDNDNDGCKSCQHNKSGLEEGYYCINNCINGSMFLLNQKP